MPELRNFKQERFCQTYATTLNVSEAEKAGQYADKYGYQLLDKPSIRDRIQEIQRGTADRMVVGQNMALRETVYLATSDITDTLHCASPEDFKSLPEHVRKAISEINITERKIVLGKDSDGNLVTDIERKLKIKMHGKQGPLQTLAQVTGLLDADNRDKEQLAFTGIDIVADITEARRKKAELLEHRNQEDPPDDTAASE